LRLAIADRGKELIRSIEANWKVFLIRLVRMPEMLIFNVIRRISNSH